MELLKRRIKSPRGDIADAKGADEDKDSKKKKKSFARKREDDGDKSSSSSKSGGSSPPSRRGKETKSSPEAEEEKKESSRVKRTDSERLKGLLLKKHKKEDATDRKGSGAAEASLAVENRHRRGVDIAHRMVSAPNLGLRLIEVEADHGDPASEKKGKKAEDPALQSSASSPVLRRKAVSKALTGPLERTKKVVESESKRRLMHHSHASAQAEPRSKTPRATRVTKQDEDACDSEGEAKPRRMSLGDGRDREREADRESVKEKEREKGEEKDKEKEKTKEKEKEKEREKAKEREREKEKEREKAPERKKEEKERTKSVPSKDNEKEKDAKEGKKKRKTKTKEKGKERHKTKQKHKDKHAKTKAKKESNAEPPEKKEGKKRKNSKDREKASTLPPKKPAFMDIGFVKAQFMQQYCSDGPMGGQGDRLRRGQSVIAASGAAAALHLNLSKGGSEEGGGERKEEETGLEDLMSSFPVTGRNSHGKVRSATVKRPLDQDQEKGADIILNALKNQMGTQSSAASVETSSVIADAKLSGRGDGVRFAEIQESMKLSGGLEDPVPPAPPPPPTSSIPMEGANMLAGQSEEFYESLFGVHLDFLESVGGVHRWRIERLCPVFLPADSEDHGSNEFYAADCYLVLSRHFKQHEAGVERTSGEEGTFKLHYWIGEYATVEKKVSVCIAATQLNAYLGGRAAHHPEAQYEESSLFMSYFEETGINYLDGGTECCLNSTKTIQEWDVPRLYRFYRLGEGGHLLVDRVACSTASLAHSDVFILDTGGFRLFVWNGADSDKALQYQSREIALLVNTKERKSKAVVEVLNGKDGPDGDHLFWEYLARGTPESESSKEAEPQTRAEAPTPDVDEEKPRNEEKPTEEPTVSAEREQGEGGNIAQNNPQQATWEVFIVLGKASGSISVESVWRRQREDELPSKQLLVSDQVFLLDFISELFVYHGSRCSPYSSQLAYFIAEQILADHTLGRPSWAQIEVVKERKEPVMFKARFSGWMEEDTQKESCDIRKRDFRSASQRLLDEIVARGAAFKKPPKVDIDVQKLLPPKILDRNVASARENGAQEHLEEEEARESVEVGVLHGGRTFVKIPVEEQGHFFSAETYVIIRTVSDTQTMEQREDSAANEYRQRWMVYFWEGKDSSALRWPTFLLGLYPLLEQNILLNSGIPSRERIWQQREPAEFMDIFPSKTIFVHRGTRMKALKKKRLQLYLPIPPNEDPQTERRLLYQAECRYDGAMHLVEIPLSPVLDQKGNYLVLSADAIFIWSGNMASNSVHTKVKRRALQLQRQLSATREREIVELWEGDDCDDFWRLLQKGSTAGEAERADEDFDALQQHEARLVRFYYEAGVLKAKEVEPFSQHDLENSRVILLDGGRALEAPIFAWFGSKTTDSLQECCWGVAELYCNYISSVLMDEIKGQGADEGSLSRRPLVRVHEGQEPDEFIRQFHDWTRETFVDPYEVRMKARKEREELERQMELAAIAEQEQLQQLALADAEIEFEQRRCIPEVQENWDDNLQTQQSEPAPPPPEEDTVPTVEREALMYDQDRVLAQLQDLQMRVLRLRQLDILSSLLALEKRTLPLRYQAMERKYASLSERLEALEGEQGPTLPEQQPEECQALEPAHVEQANCSEQAAQIPALVSECPNTVLEQAENQEQDTPAQHEDDTVISSITLTEEIERPEEIHEEYRPSPAPQAIVQCETSPADQTELKASRKDDQTVCTHSPVLPECTPEPGCEGGQNSTFDTRIAEDEEPAVPLLGADQWDIPTSMGAEAASITPKELDVQEGAQEGPQQVVPCVDTEGPDDTMRAELKSQQEQMLEDLLNLGCRVLRLRQQKIFAALAGLTARVNSRLAQQDEAKC